MKVHENAFCPECGHQLEGDEFLCPSCGFKLADKPVEQSPPPVNETPPPPPPSGDVTPPVPPVETPQITKEEAPVTPPVEEPKDTPKEEPKEEPQNIPPQQETTPPQQGLFNQPPSAQVMPVQKKSLLWLWIILIVLGVLIIASAVGAFLIYNGTIPRDKVDFLPKVVMEQLAPKTNTAPVSTSPRQVFFLAYSFTLLEENNEKVIIISSVMDPGSATEANEFGAKNSFNEFAKINYPDDYFFFKNVKIKSFTSREDAFNEREKLKKDYKRKGYTLRLMEVVYSIK